MPDNSKVVLVVGGACGIGNATVATLMAQNYRVICADINSEKLGELEIKYKNGCILLLVYNVGFVEKLTALSIAPRYSAKIYMRKEIYCRQCYIARMTFHRKQTRRYFFTIIAAH